MPDERSKPSDQLRADELLVAEEGTARRQAQDEPESMNDGGYRGSDEQRAYEQAARDAREH
jgi:hypothetical protein